MSWGRSTTSREQEESGDVPFFGPPTSARPRRLVLISAFALALLCFLTYLANGRTTPHRLGFDTIPNRLIPFSILKDGKLTVERFGPALQEAGGFSGYLMDRDGRLVSFYPIGTAIVALPFYVPHYLFLKAEGRDSYADLLKASELAEKLAASAIAAIAVGLMFLYLAQVTTYRGALLISVAYGLATSVWAIASQQLWQHGPAVLCLTIALLSLQRRSSLARALIAGLALGSAVAVRPQLAVFLPAPLLALLIRRSERHHKGWSMTAYGVGAIVPIVAVGLYNLASTDAAMGAYGHLTSRFSLQTTVAGTAGLLLSPNRGLFVFMPVSIIGVIGLAMAARRWRRNPLIVGFGIAACAHLLLHASFDTWAGGWSFGPRFLTEILPVLAAASPIALRRLRLRSLMGAALGVLLLWSFLVQVNGSFFYSSSNWNARMSHDLERNAWNLHHVALWEDFVAWAGSRAPRGENEKEEEGPAENVASEGRSPPASRRVPPLPPSAFRVKWEEVDVPSRVRAGEEVQVRVRLTNASDQLWPDPELADPDHPGGALAVRLGYRWLADDVVVDDYGKRVDLAVPLPTDWSAALEFPVRAPQQAGSYSLQIDLVQELVGWFADRGADRLVVPVRVLPEDDPDLGSIR